MADQHENFEELPGINPALLAETQKVMRQRRWSIAAAEKYTGTNRATVYNMQRGFKSVKIPNIIKFARAVAPPGEEDMVERRWTQIAMHGYTDLPDVDYHWKPGSRLRPAASSGDVPVARTITEPELVEAVEYLEMLPDYVREPVIGMIRESAFLYNARKRKKVSPQENCPA